MERSPNGGHKQVDANYFELFGLSPAFAIDMPRLDDAYRKLQRHVHPDKHVVGSSTEQRYAAQRAALANEAYEALRRPLPRARHLVQLHNVDPDAGALPSSFLFQQMEFREAVQQARRSRDHSALSNLRITIQRDLESLLGKLAQQIDSEGDFENAARSTQMLQFSLKLAADTNDALEELEG